MNHATDDGRLSVVKTLLEYIADPPGAPGDTHPCLQLHGEGFAYVWQYMVHVLLEMKADAIDRLIKILEHKGLGVKMTEDIR